MSFPFVGLRPAGALVAAIFGDLTRMWRGGFTSFLGVKSSAKGLELGEEVSGE
jgi:hypothetical protein